MINQVLISCIIPTYNRSCLVKEAIESTLSQTYPNWELLVVDDGSSDDTEALVNAYSKSDHRIKYFRNLKKGGSSARNFGIRKARGKYIAFLDDDDISLPHRFESQLSAAQISGSRFIVSGYQVREREDNKLKANIKLELKGKGAGFPSRWMIERGLLSEVNGFDEDFPSMQDVELSYRMSDHEEFVLHDDIVSVIYQTKSSVSTRVENLIQGKLLLMDRRESIMSEIEAAWWYYSLSLEFYATGNRRRAVDFLKKAAEMDSRGYYLIGYHYARLFFPLTFIIKRINQKILGAISNFRFPKIIEHEIISTIGIPSPIE